MPVSDKHPAYADRIGEWTDVRVVARGETAVKRAGTEYLPMPTAFKAQTDGGSEMFRAYLTRASFPDYFQPTLRGMVGVIHKNEAKIEIPSSLEFLWENASPDGLPLEKFHERITTELLMMGRYSVLVDPPADGGLPLLVGHRAEYLINWDEKRDFFVIDESGNVRQGFSWKPQEKYRVLRLEDGRYVQHVHTSAVDNEFEIVEPRRGAGGGTLDVIPFVVAGARELALTPDEPPLIGIVRAALTAYRLDADYKHQLFMTGQETLFIINGEAPTYVGAGVIVSLNSEGSEDLQPDAKYVGPAGVGIEAHRIAIEDCRDAAAAAGARLFEEEQAGQAESGNAREMRMNAQTATLQTISRASAACLEQALRHAARFLSLPESEIEAITVTGNTEFVDATMPPSEAESLMRMWQGAAISKRTLHENLLRGGIASPERSYEEEEDEIETTIDDIPSLNPDPEPTNPNDPNAGGG